MKTNVTNHMNRIRKRKSHNHTIRPEKAFDKIHYPCVIKTHSKCRIQRNCLSMIKISKIYTANIMLNGEKLETRCPLSTRI